MRSIGIIFGVLLSLLAQGAAAQSVTEYFRLGQDLMQQSSLTTASGTLFNSGFSVTPAEKGVVLAGKNDASLRLASRERGSQQIDTVRMELRTNKNVGQLTTEMLGMGFMFLEAHDGFVSYQRDAIKVAVFNPYKFKDYKIAFVFARDPNVAAPAAVQPVAPTQPSATSAAVETITVNGVSFKMVRVQGGTFTMGATSEQGSDAGSDKKPAHQVTLSTFSIGETEVTQELWQAVMGNNPSNFKGAKRPVEQVSWEDCQDFIRELNSLTGRRFRLPTEAEWEYAARDGNKGNGHKYAGSSAIDNVAWYAGNSRVETHDVATKQPNELGLYDMSGNVWEWCQDWYGLYSSNSQTNPTGASSGSYRVGRGGCWFSNARYCRVSDRSLYTPSDRYLILGLRLAF